MRWLGPAVVAVGLISCEPAPGYVDPNPTDEASPVPLPAHLAIVPSVAELGQQLTATIKGVSTAFDDATTVELGDGVTASSVVVLNSGELEVALSVAPDATPGYRTLTVRSGSGAVKLEQALLVQLGSVSITPNVAIPGQSIEVDVTVSGLSEVTQGYTWMSFGEGVTTHAVTWDGTTHAVAQLTVDSSAAPGLRDVSVEDGPTRITLPDGFTIDRGLIAIAFDPPQVAQGQEVAFTITGYGTHFKTGQTALDLGLGVLTTSDVASYVVQSPTRITGTMDVCDAAVIGAHDVVVTTGSSNGPPEQVRALEGFVVDEVPPGLAQASGYFSLGLSRSMHDGEVWESIYGYAIFTAVVSSCGTSNGSPCYASPPKYDTPVFYPPEGCTPVPNTTQYPPSPTFDAGAHVYFEVPGGPLITLDKVVDTEGSIYYSSLLDIPLEDMIFGEAYDVSADGAEGEATIPAFEAEGVLLTMPSDFTLVTPDLRDEPILNRYDAFPVTWTDSNGQPGAGTFPYAEMSSRMHTNDVNTGYASEIRVIPEDDGNYVYPADLVSQLYPGPGHFYLSTNRIGIPFYIEGSPYPFYPVSGVSYDGIFELRD